MSEKYDYDAIIIGAGISGLVCGCYLAKAGLKTLIVEKNAKPGGYCTSFRSNGFHFDACAHALSSLRKQGRMYQISKELGLDISKIKRNDPSDIIITPEHKIWLFNNLEKTINEFVKSFPRQKRGITNLFKFMVNTPLNNLKELRSKTFKDLLDTYITDEKLKTILSVFTLGLLGSNSNKTSATVAVLCIREFIFDGGYYPQGGMQAFADSLANRFLEFKGTMKTLTKAESIIIRDNSAVGASFNKGSRMNAKYIISACDAMQTFTKLISEDNIDPKFLRKLDEMDVSLSAFIVYLGLKAGSSDYPYLKANAWVINDYNLNELVKGIEECKNNYFLISSPSSKNGNTLQTGEASLCLVVNAIYKNEEYWKNMKNELADRLVSLADHVLPGIKERISSKIIATPITLHKWTLNYKGASYGWESTPSQFCDPDLSQNTQIKNLYLTGHWSNQSSGITFVANCGFDTADIIMRRERIS